MDRLRMLVAFLGIIAVLAMGLEIQFFSDETSFMGSIRSRGSKMLASSRKGNERPTHDTSESPNTMSAMTNSSGEGGTDDVANRGANSTDSKPTLVFFAGPGKTGTTFLQSALSLSSWKTDPILLKDNLTYWGTAPGYADRKFLHHKKEIFRQDSGNGKWSKDFLDHLQQFKGTNGLLIYEWFNPTPNLTRSLKELLDPHWNVQIVISYRTFHEWALSYYNQISKEFIRDASEWPEEGGFDLLPFSVLFAGDLSDVQLPFYMERIATAISKRVHIAANRMRSFSSDFNVIDVMPIQVLQGPKNATGGNGKIVDPMLEYMFCHPGFLRVPTAHTCDAVRAGEFDTGVKSANPSMNLDPDLLAVAAHKRGMVVSNITRPMLRDKISSFLASSNVVLDTVCPSQEKLAFFEKVSWDMEVHMFPNLPDEEGRRASHMRGFQKKADAGAYCDMDIDATLQKPWLEELLK